jgi:tetratricopeptide (TPR) repeat protein
MNKKTILVATANPVDSSQIRTSAFYKAIKKGLIDSEKPHDYEVIFQPDTNLDDFFRELEKHKNEICILHLVGHGDRLDRFLFEDEDGGKEFAKPTQFAEHLYHYKDTLECVVISACHSQTLAKKIVQEINFAIGYDDPLGVEVAKEYAEKFYFFLANGNNYESANGLTQTAMKTKIAADKIPQLFTKTEEKSKATIVNFKKIISEYLTSVMNHKDFKKVNDLHIDLLAEEKKYIDYPDNEDGDSESQQTESEGYKQTILNIAANKRRFIIRGGSGTGKSFTLKKILFENAKQLLTSPTTGFKIPILIECGKYTSENTFKKIIERQFPDVETLLQKGALLLFDAINEVNQLYIEEANINLKNLLAHYPNTDLIISTRYDRRAESFKLPIFDLCPLTIPQIQSFVSKYLPEGEGFFKRTLDGKENLKKLGTSPLLLQMITEERAFNSKGQLFKTFVDKIFNREIDEKNDAINPKTKKDVLSYLAFKSRESGYYRQIPKEKAEYWIGDKLEKIDVVKLNVLYKNLCSIAILAEEGENLSWQHEIYGEYFAALFLKTEWVAKDKLPCENSISDRWHEALLMSADLLMEQEDKKKFYKKYLNPINTQLRKDNYFAGALPFIELGKELFPEEGSYVTEYVSSLRKLERVDEAIVFINGLANKERQIMNELGICYKLKKDYDRAISIFSKNIDEFPDEPYSKTQLGVCYKLKKDYDRAINIFKENIDIFPNDLRSRTELGICYKLKKDYDEAIRIFIENIRLFPHAISSRNELAICYTAKREYLNAAEILTSEAYSQYLYTDRPILMSLISTIKDNETDKKNIFHSLQKLHVNFKNELGICYKELKQYDEAIEIFEEIKDINDPSKLELGMCYKEKRNYDKAIQIFMEMSKSTQAQNELGICYRLIKDYGKAISIFEKNIEKDSNNIYSKQGLGRCYMEQGNYKQAAEIFADNIKKEPKSIYTNKALSNFINKIEQIEDTVDIFYELIVVFEKIKNDDELSKIALAICYQKINQFDKAIDIFEKVVKKKDTIKNILYLATCYQEAKKFRNAINLLEKALEKYPTDIQLQNQLDKYNICEIYRVYDKIGHWVIEVFEVKSKERQPKIKFGKRDLPKIDGFERLEGKIQKGQQFIFIREKGMKTTLVALYSDK